MTPSSDARLAEIAYFVASRSNPVQIVNKLPFRSVWHDHRCSPPSTLDSMLDFANRVAAQDS